MPLWRTFYHIVWTTKKRLPLISEEIEPALFRHIAQKTKQYGGVFHAVGGVEDHVHLVASIPPKISVSEFVGKIKGASARFANRELRAKGKAFAWQDGYGVFTLGESQLARAIGYAENQKRHHRERTTVRLLEMDRDPDADRMEARSGGNQPAPPANSRNR